MLDAIRSANGFITHTNGPVPGGWRVIEVWESQADFEAWFESSVKPAFPEATLAADDDQTILVWEEPRIPLDSSPPTG